MALGLLAACSGGGDSIAPSGGGGGPGGPGAEGNPLEVRLEFSVANSSADERTETIRASVPFPRGGYSSLAGLAVSGHQTAWMPMQFWADGTVKMAQAQFTDTLAPGETKHYTVARDATALTGPFTRNTWVDLAGAGLQIGAEVRDTFSVDYRAVATGPGEVLQETPLVQVQRWRTYHTALGSGGIGRDYLTSTFYVTEFRDMPFVLVDWILGNDYLGADVVPPGNTDPNLHPLGTVDVMRARFLCKGMQGAQAYLPDKERISAATSHGDGFTAFQAMEDTFLADGQTRRYRFLLRFQPSNADPLAAARWQTVSEAMFRHPLYPLATHQTWEETKGAGLLGGPVAGPTDSHQRAEHDYQSWIGGDHFGTWGSHGEVMETATTGTPRNHPLGPDFAHAIQGQHHRLLQKVELQAWMQAARPYHLYDLEVGAEQEIYLWGGLPHYVSHESLGREALQQTDPYAAYRTMTVGQHRSHGWNAFDTEHFTVDLLFDYWCISGDAWAKEELRQVGQSLKGTLRLQVYSTSHAQAARAEGWCMQAFVQCCQATQDESLEQYVIRRVHEVVDPTRRREHASKAMVFQSNYPNTSFPMDHKFFMPWQHGSVLYGYLAAYKYWEDPLLLTIAEDVLDTMDYSWVSNINHPTLGFVANGLRYYTPVEHNGTPIPADYWDSTPGIGPKLPSSPLGSVNTMLLGGLFQLAVLTDDEGVRTRAVNYGTLMLGQPTEDGRWDKWQYCIPSYYYQ